MRPGTGEAKPLWMGLLIIISRGTTRHGVATEENSILRHVRICLLPMCAIQSRYILLISERSQGTSTVMKLPTHAPLLLRQPPFPCMHVNREQKEKTHTAQIPIPKSAKPRKARRGWRQPPLSNPTGHSHLVNTAPDASIIFLGAGEVVFVRLGAQVAAMGVSETVRTRSLPHAVFLR